jgi:hypothetical protein
MPEDRHLHNHWCEDLKSYKILLDYRIKKFDLLLTAWDSYDNKVINLKGFETKGSPAISFAQKDRGWVRKFSVCQTVCGWVRIRCLPHDRAVQLRRITNSDGVRGMPACLFQGIIETGKIQQWQRMPLFQTILNSKSMRQSKCSWKNLSS